MEIIECKEANCGNPVFSRGVCRKHYEQEKLVTASPCSFSGCQEKSYRGTLCAAHYRQKTKSERPICIVANCTGKQKNLTTGLCDRHQFRQDRHGSLEQPRAADWGARASHPLYQAWYAQKRKGDLCQEWVDDFWAMVYYVGERADGYTLRRINDKRPLGPDNWYWKEAIPSKDKAAYTREWRRANPDKAKNADLKKMYGITLQEYDAKAKAQSCRCAICGNTEDDTDGNGRARLLAVDHDHKTGKIRALLCGTCNRGIGKFKDDPALLRKAAIYLETWK